MNQHQSPTDIVANADRFHALGEISIVDYINQPPDAPAAAGVHSVPHQTEDARESAQLARTNRGHRLGFSEKAVEVGGILLLAAFFSVFGYNWLASTRADLREIARLQRQAQEYSDQAREYTAQSEGIRRQSERAARDYETFKTVVALRQSPGFTSEFVKLPANVAEASDLDAVVRNINLVLKNGDPRAAAALTPNRRELIITGTPAQIARAKELIDPAVVPEFNARVR